jgi:hypothetical protein
VAEHDEALSGHSALLPQIPVCGVRITIQAMLARRTTALPITPVIECEKVEPEPAESSVVCRAVELREVPRIAMADQQPEAVRAVRRRHDPTHQLHTIGGGELGTLYWKLQRGWWERESTLCTGEVDQAGFGQPQ